MWPILFAFGVTFMPTWLGTTPNVRVGIQCTEGQWILPRSAHERTFTSKYMNCKIRDDDIVEAFMVHNVPVALIFFEEETPSTAKKIVMNKGTIILTDCADSMRRGLVERHGDVDTSVNPAFKNIP